MADAEGKRAYPIFTDVEQYMRRRVRRTPMGLLKTWAEERALRRCLKGLENIGTICDVPSGPGRLFPFWRRQSFCIHGRDISVPMLKAAEIARQENHLPRSVCFGDAFNLHDCLHNICDLVVSVRFLYYFERDKRNMLLRSFAATVATIVGAVIA